MKDWKKEFKHKAMTNAKKETNNRHDEKRWKEMVKELMKFKKKFKHMLVPRKYKQLDGWVHAQRKYFCKLVKGQNLPMTRKRIEILDKIDFQFCIRKKYINNTPKAIFLIV